MATQSLRETVREDGLRIITKRMPSTKKVRLAVVGLVGNAYDELYQLNGLFHFFEHTAFDGTKTRTAEEMDMFQDRYLYTSNAYTESLLTNYYGEAIHLRFDELCDFIFDAHLHSIYPEDQLQKEKGAIKGEIRGSLDNDQHQVHQALYRLLWQKNPLRNMGVCGTIKDIEKVSREMLLQMKAQWLIPSNTIVIGTGRINHDELARKAYYEFPFNEATVSHPVWNLEFPDPPADMRTVIARPRQGNALIVAGCKIGLFSDHERNVIAILYSMFDGGQSTLLNRELRRRRGWTYSTWGGWYGYKRLGYFLSFGTEMDPAQLEDGEHFLSEILFDIPLDFDLFTRTRDWLIEHLILDFEHLSTWELTILNCVSDAMPLTRLHNYIQKRERGLMRVTFDEVRAMRAKLLRPETTAFAILRPE